MAIYNPGLGVKYGSRTTLTQLSMSLLPRDPQGRGKLVLCHQISFLTRLRLVSKNDRGFSFPFVAIGFLYLTVGKSQN